MQGKELGMPAGFLCRRVSLTVFPTEHHKTSYAEWGLFQPLPALFPGAVGVTLTGIRRCKGWGMASLWGLRSVAAAALLMVCSWTPNHLPPGMGNLDFTGCVLPSHGTSLREAAVKPQSFLCTWQSFHLGNAHESNFLKHRPRHRQRPRRLKRRAAALQRAFMSCSCLSRLNYHNKM